MQLKTALLLLDENERRLVTRNAPLLEFGPLATVHRKRLRANKRIQNLVDLPLQELVERAAAKRQVDPVDLEGLVHWPSGIDEWVPLAYVRLQTAIRKNRPREILGILRELWPQVTGVNFLADTWGRQIPGVLLDALESAGDEAADMPFAPRIAARAVCPDRDCPWSGPERIEHLQRLLSGRESSDPFTETDIETVTEQDRLMWATVAPVPATFDIMRRVSAAFGAYYEYQVGGRSPGWVAGYWARIIASGRHGAPGSPARRKRDGHLAIRILFTLRNLDGDGRERAARDLAWVKRDHELSPNELLLEPVRAVAGRRGRGIAAEWSRYARLGELLRDRPAPRDP